MSADGTKFAVAWKDVRTGEPNVYWAISEKPGFDQESLAHEETEGEQDHPSLAINGTGMTWVTWEDERGGHRRVWVRSSQPADKGRAISGMDEAPASYSAIATGSQLVAVVYESGKQNLKNIRFRMIANLHGN